MIKAGDQVILDGVEYFVNDIGSGSVSLYKGKNPLSVMFMNEKTLYVKLYEQQKQRADELAELYVQSEKESESLSISLCERIERYHERTTKLIQEKSKAVERADELEKRWS